MAKGDRDNIKVGIEADLGPLQDDLKAGQRDMGEFGTAAARAADGGIRKLETAADGAGKSARTAAGKTKEFGKAAGESAGQTDRLAESTKKADGALGPVAGKLDQIKSRLTAGGLAMAAFATATGIARNELEKLRRVEEAGGQGIESTADAETRLFGLDTDVNKVNQMIARSHLTALQTSLTPQETLGLMFDAQSSGFAGQFEGVANAAQLVGTDVASAGGLIGSKFGLSTIQSISAINAASVESLADAGQLVAGGKAATAGAAAAGSSGAEMLGFLAAMSNATQDPTISGNLIKTFGLKAGNNEELKGLGLMGAVEKLQGDDELRADFIKDNQELQRLFNEAITKKFIEDYTTATNAAIAEIESGGAELGTKLSNLNANERFIARTATQNAEEALQLGGNNPAQAQMRVDAMMDQRRGAMAMQGAVGGEAIDAPFIVGGMLRGLSPEDAIREGIRASGERPGTGQTVTEAMVEALEQIRKNTTPQPAVPAQVADTLN